MRKSSNKINFMKDRFCNVNLIKSITKIIKLSKFNKSTLIFKKNIFTPCMYLELTGHF